MRNDDKAEFAKRLYEMFKAFRKADEFDDDTVAIWWNRLHQDFAIEDFKVAATEMEKISKFLPVIANFFELKRLAEAYSETDAWGDVLEHLRSGAYRRRGIGDDKIDRAVRAMGGYRALAMRNEDDLTIWGFKRFREHYSDVFASVEREESLLLPGGSDPLLLH